MMLSPYFSPSRSRGKAILVDHRPSASEDNADDGSRSRNISRFSCPTRFPTQDPLFGFYFRKFLNLYQLLYTLKPNLIQESVGGDPWKLLVAVTLLNKTTARAAIPVFWDLMKEWPTAWAMSQACCQELKTRLHRLGTYNVRSERLIELSRAYSLDPPSEHDARPSRPTKRSTSDHIRRSRERYPSTPISHLPGIGPYALDSYRIFCTSQCDPFSKKWQVVHPMDKELVLYLRWKWAYEERKEWSPATGLTIPVDVPYLEMLVNDLTDFHIRQRTKGKVEIPKHK